VEAAVQYFYKKRTLEPDVILFEEREMNALVYQLLQKNEVKIAIELFKLNVVAYPYSANVYDSLGEAYMKDGQNNLAIQNYRKSLELNQNNNNAREKLMELKLWRNQKEKNCH